MPAVERDVVSLADLAATIDSASRDEMVCSPEMTMRELEVLRLIERRSEAAACARRHGLLALGRVTGTESSIAD